MNSLQLNLLFVLTALVALVVFMSYTRPDFIVTLANQIWLCF